MTDSCPPKRKHSRYPQIVLTLLAVVSDDSAGTGNKGVGENARTVSRWGGERTSQYNYKGTREGRLTY